MVEVPEEKKLSSAGRGAADVSEKVGFGIPKDSIEAENHFVEIAKSEAFDGSDFPVGKRRNELNDVLGVRRVRIGASH